jgi:hypothetical protein
MKNFPQKLLLAVLGASYLSIVAQWDLNFLFFKGYIALVPIQTGALIYMLVVRSRQEDEERLY